jgi:hypothetical protein
VHDLLQLILSAALGGLGCMALWTGAIALDGPDGLGPRCTVRGLAARFVGALLVTAAVVLFVSVGIGLLVFASAVVTSSLACSRTCD